MFSPKLNSKFNIPLTVVKNCHWQNVLKETKSQFLVCLGTADSTSISVSPTKGSRFVIKRNKLKPRKQSLKQHKTARRYSCK